MEADILKKIDEQGLKIDAMYASLEKIRGYLKWTFIITIALVVLPLIGLLFAIPTFLSTYSSIGNSGL